MSKPKNRRKSQVSVEVLDTEDVESSPAAKSPIKVETNPKGKSAKAEVKRKDNVTPPSSDVASPQISATPSSPVPNSGSQQKLESGNTQPNTASSTEYKASSFYIALIHWMLNDQFLVLRWRSRHYRMELR